jgi:hypothetical protein
MTVLEIKEVAQKLKKSPRWVYAHAYELGAAKIGGSLIFTQEGVENAILRSQQEGMERRSQNPRQAGGNETISHKAGSVGLGRRNVKRDDGILASARRHGLIDLQHKVS